MELHFVSPYPFVLSHLTSDRESVNEHIFANIVYSVHLYVITRDLQTTLK